MARTAYWAALVALLVLASSRPAHAYLDPGTGSIILQGILGAIAGALVFGRTYLQRLKSLLGLGPRIENHHRRPSD